MEDEEILDDVLMGAYEAVCCWLPRALYCTVLARSADFMILPGERGRPILDTTHGRRLVGGIRLIASRF